MLSKRTLLISLLMAVITFTGGYFLGLKTTNFSNTGSAKSSVSAPGIGFSARQANPHFAYSVIGQITGLIFNPDGNRTIEVTGFNLKDFFINQSNPSLGDNQNPDQSRTDAPTEPVACTLDAKICPDGSSVGRIGPNCEFAPCPDTVCTMDTKECPDGSFVGRTGPNCEFKPCPDTVCTMDTKECPDGSSVGRTGPRCEFKPCPGEKPPLPPTAKPVQPPLITTTQFLVTSQTRITRLALPVQNVPNRPMRDDNTPSADLTINDLKAGMKVVVYPDSNPKLARMIEVVATSDPDCYCPNGKACPRNDIGLCPEPIPGCVCPDGKACPGNDVGLCPDPIPVTGDWNFQCSQDSDCTLVNTEQAFQCCQDDCQPVDYSQDKWISVNYSWYKNKIANSCSTAGRCAEIYCDPKMINDRYVSQCANSYCRKVPSRVNRPCEINENPTCTMDIQYMVFPPTGETRKVASSCSCGEDVKTLLNKGWVKNQNNQFSDQ